MASKAKTESPTDTKQKKKTNDTTGGSNHKPKTSVKVDVELPKEVKNATFKVPNMC